MKRLIETDRPPSLRQPGKGTGLRELRRQDRRIRRRSARGRPRPADRPRGAHRAGPALLRGRRRHGARQAGASSAFATDANAPSRRRAARPVHGHRFRPCSPSAVFASPTDSRGKSRSRSWTDFPERFAPGRRAALASRRRRDPDAFAPGRARPPRADAARLRGRGRRRRARGRCRAASCSWPSRTPIPRPTASTTRTRCAASRCEDAAGPACSASASGLEHTPAGPMLSVDAGRGARGPGALRASDRRRGRSRGRRIVLDPPEGSAGAVSAQETRPAMHDGDPHDLPGLLRVSAAGEPSREGDRRGHPRRSRSPTSARFAADRHRKVDDEPYGGGAGNGHDGAGRRRGDRGAPGCGRRSRAWTRPDEPGRRPRSISRARPRSRVRPRVLARLRALRGDRRAGARSRPLRRGDLARRFRAPRRRGGGPVPDRGASRGWSRASSARRSRSRTSPSCGTGSTIPHYTRPREFRGAAVPEVLLSGDHRRIERWRRARALERTRQRRPDLLEERPLEPGEGGEGNFRSGGPIICPEPGLETRTALRVGSTVPWDSAAGLRPPCFGRGLP